MHNLIQQHYGFVRQRVHESPRITPESIPKPIPNPNPQSIPDAILIQVLKETPREIYATSILADLKQVIYHMQEPEPPVDPPVESDIEPMPESPRRTLEELNEIREVNVRKRGRPPKVPILIISAEEEIIEQPPSIKKTVSRVKKVIKANIAASTKTPTKSTSTKTTPTKTV